MNVWECAKCHIKYKPTPSLDSYEFAKSLMPFYDVSNFVDEMPDIDDAAVEISEYVTRRLEEETKHTDSYIRHLHASDAINKTLREALERIANRSWYDGPQAASEIARDALAASRKGE